MILHFMNTQQSNTCTSSYPFTAVDMTDGGEEKLHHLVTQYGETPTLEEFLEAREDGALGLYHECERIKERVEEEFFPVGL